jgi:hypothetical protein
MYNKTFFTSPKKLFVAKVETATGLHHIFFMASSLASPLFSFDCETNRFLYIGGPVDISPEALRDIADLGAGIFNDNN